MKNLIRSTLKYYLPPSIRKIFFIACGGIDKEGVVKYFTTPSHSFSKNLLTI